MQYVHVVHAEQKVKMLLQNQFEPIAHGHTTSFWNITIHWTSHDDLTEKNSESFVTCQIMFSSKSSNQSEGQEHGWDSLHFFSITGYLIAKCVQ